MLSVRRVFACSHSLQRMNAWNGEASCQINGAVSAVRGFNLIDQMSASKAVIGLNMLTLWKAHGSLKPWIDPLQEMIASGVISPVVSDVVPFDRAADAHRIIVERRNIGKVVLVP